MGFWGYVRACVRQVICLHWGLRWWTFLGALFTIIGLCLSSVAILWSQSGWGRVTRVVVRKVVESVVEAAGVENWWEVVEVAACFLLRVWEQLRGPLAELALAVTELVVRCIVYAGVYLVLGSFSLLCGAAGIVVESVVNLVGEGTDFLCASVCSVGWGEVACIVFC